MILTLFDRLPGHRSGARHAVPLLLKTCAYVFKRDTLPAAAPGCIDCVQSPDGGVIVRTSGFILGK